MTHKHKGSNHEDPVQSLAQLVKQNCYFVILKTYHNIFETAVDFFLQ